MPRSLSSPSMKPQSGRAYVRLSNVLWLLIPFTFSPLHFAHAYVDPGSGSYAIQIAIGVIFGATYTLRSFGSKIVDKIRSRSGKK